MILETTQAMYYAFLDGIKKEFTGTVVPEVFNRIINEWGQYEWLRQNVSQSEGIELSQKQIDDLQVLVAVLDNQVPVITGPLPAINPVSTDIFPLPDLASGPTASPVGYYVNLASYPSGVAVDYPRYYRLLNVFFKIRYVGNVCGLIGDSEWLSAKIMRSDRESVILDNPFRRPADDNLYYRIINRHIQLITGTSSYGIGMKPTYLRWPRNIFFDQTNQDDLANADYMPGNGSINCELPPHIRKEIVDTAVRIYLERVRDPRYQSYLMESKIRNQANF